MIQVAFTDRMYNQTRQLHKIAACFLLLSREVPGLVVPPLKVYWYSEPYLQWLYICRHNLDRSHRIVDWLYKWRLRRVSRRTASLCFELLQMSTFTTPFVSSPVWNFANVNSERPSSSKQQSGYMFVEGNWGWKQSNEHTWWYCQHPASFLTCCYECCSYRYIGCSGRYKKKLRLSYFLLSSEP